MNTKALTEFFYKNGLDPLNFMDIVPAYFRCGDKTIDTVVIPDGIKHIWGSAFKTCMALTEVYIPSSVRTINYECFLGCDSLSEVTFAQGR